MNRGYYQLTTRPNRSDLDPTNPLPNIGLIESTFHAVRGAYTLWQSPREKGRWKKIETAALTLNWISENVEVVYPSPDRFEVSELKGIVLWKDSGDKKYKLYEGNHRISAWLAAQTPKSLPAVIFIGKPAKLSA